VRLLKSNTTSRVKAYRRNASSLQYAWQSVPADNAAARAWQGQL
jgi:hypothetical protein